MDYIIVGPSKLDDGVYTERDDSDPYSLLAHVCD